MGNVVSHTANETPVNPSVIHHRHETHRILGVLSKRFEWTLDTERTVYISIIGWTNLDFIFYLKRYEMYLCISLRGVACSMRVNKFDVLKCFSQKKSENVYSSGDRGSK